MRTGVEEATVKFASKVLALCGEFLHCVYDGEGLSAEMKGSLLSGHSTLSEQTMHKVEGFLCPSTTKLDLLIGSSESVCSPTAEPVYISK